jgi:hypothetical protein
MESSRPLKHDSDVFAGPGSTRPKRARRKVARIEANPAWLVDFWGAVLSEPDKRRLATRHIAVLSPGVAALGRALGQPLNPRHQSAWVEAPTRGHAVAMVVSALSVIGAYKAFTASRAR